MISELEKLIEEGRSLQLVLKSATYSVPPEFSFWRAKVTGLLRRAYGNQSPELARWNSLEQSYELRKDDGSTSGYQAKIHCVNGISLLFELQHSTAGDGLNVSATHRPAIQGSGRVFIIHGHDEQNTLRLEKLIRVRFLITPVVLKDEPGSGRTLIDKFEEEASDCQFAFALLTPDDQIIRPDGEYTQARPNVVFELGWFYAKLGRDKVALLIKHGTHLHSDLKGIEYYVFREDVTEQALKIEDELVRAGLLVPHAERRQGKD